MSNQSARSKRRNRAKKTNTPLYLGLGLAGVIGLIIILVVVLNKPLTASTGQPLDASIPVGQTEDGFWYKGNPDAPIKVVEYADYECPACKQMESTLASKDFDTTYIKPGYVQYIYREFPLSSIHPAAYQAAEVARCSGDQDPALFWPVHDALFATQSSWNNGKPDAQSILIAAASDAGADKSAVEACVAAGTHAEFVQNAEKTAPGEGATSTPTFIVNGNQVSGGSLFDVMDKILEQQGLNQ